MKIKCLNLLLWLLLIHKTQPMESLVEASSGCKPWETICTLWSENKRLLLCSTTVFLGGLFVFDWFSKSLHIKRLEERINTLETNKSTTALFSELKRIEEVVIKLQALVERTINKDLTYIWQYVFTPEAIHYYNKIENSGNPYIHRPYIPQNNGKSILDLIKQFSASDTQEHKGEPFTLSMISPRRSHTSNSPRHSPPRSGSPTNLENGSNKKRSKKPSTPPEIKDEKEKEKGKEDN